MYTYSITMEAEWPKPCEYVQPTILASEFPINPIYRQYNSSGDRLPLSSGSGIEYYNTIKSISGLSTGSSFILTGFNNTTYQLTAIEKISSGGLTSTYGNVYYFTTDAFGNSITTLNPSVSVVSGSGLFSFTRASGGYNYTIEYTKNLNSGWNYTGITLLPASSQSGLSSGYLKEQFYYPLPTGTPSFRMKAAPLISNFIGNFGLIQSGYNKLLTVFINNDNKLVYYIISQNSGNATFIEDTDYIFICGGGNYAK